MNDPYNHTGKLLKPSQTARLRQWLDRGRAITPLECWRVLGIYRLSARIYDLKAEGYPIESSWAKVANRFGETVKVKRYRRG